MREIKFRGKRLGFCEKGKEWISGSLIKMYGGKLYITEGYNECFMPFNDYTHGQIVKYEIDPSTVGQYTGLKDKNGKEIYEGDILKLKAVDFWDEVKEVIGVVEYDLNNAEYIASGKGFEGEDVIGWWADSEIIGNIHDNPELLEDKP